MNTFGLVSMELPNIAGSMLMTTPLAARKVAKNTISNGPLPIETRSGQMNARSTQAFTHLYAVPLVLICTFVLL